MEPLHFTDENFEQEVVSSTIPVLVDFWAPWCGPCLMIAPAIEELVEDFDGRAKIGKLNVDENPAAASRFGIQSIPNIKIFKDGREVETIIGAVSKAQIADKIKESL